MKDFHATSPPKHKISSLFSIFAGNFFPPGSGSSRPKSIPIPAEQDPDHVTDFTNVAGRMQRTLCGMSTAPG